MFGYPDETLSLVFDILHHWLDSQVLTLRQSPPSRGGGAESNGVDTRRTWTREESNLHINCKGLLAASFAVNAFTKELQNVHVLIQIDNTTSIAYINKMRVPKGELVSTKADHSEGRTHSGSP